MLRQPVEDRLAERLLDGAAAGADGVHEVLQAAPDPVAAQRERGGACASGRAGLERLAQRRQAEAMVGVLGQHAETGERPHHTVERRGMAVHERRDLARGLRPARQMVGQPQFGCGMNEA